MPDIHARFVTIYADILVVSVSSQSSTTYVRRRDIAIVEVDTGASPPMLSDRARCIRKIMTRKNNLLLPPIGRGAFHAARDRFLAEAELLAATKNSISAA